MTRTAQYLKNTLNSGIKQLSVHVVLQRKELPLKLQTAGQCGHGDGLTGVAVPLHKLVEGRSRPVDGAEDVVNHLRPRLGLDLLLPLSAVRRHVERGEPLVISPQADFIVGRGVGGDQLPLPSEVIDAADSPDCVHPDVRAVAGEETPHQPEVLGTFKEQDQSVVKSGTAASASQLLEVKSFSPLEPGDSLVSQVLPPDS